MIVLDTNIISEAFALHPNYSGFTWMDQQDPGALFLTAITISELVYGTELLADGRRKQALALRISAIVTEYEGRRLPFEEEAAYIYGYISAKRKKSGHAMETKDAQIAAICLAHKATLATRNVKDFEGLDLALINPFEER